MDPFTKAKFKTSLTLVSSFRLKVEKGKKDLFMLVRSELTDSDLNLLRMQASKGETKFGSKLRRFVKMVKLASQ